MEKTPLPIFCCYARADQIMLDQLKKHLAPLQRQGQITIWGDTDLSAGAEWEKELHLYLERAAIILLLVSPDFMASDYCYSTEMSRAIQRHNQGSARVIPILLRPTFWQNSPFAKLQMLPTNAEPVTNWLDHDKAFHNVTEQINQLITGRQNQINKYSSSSASLLQPSSVVAANSHVDVSGAWVSGNFYLNLSQVGEKVTGTGSDIMVPEYVTAHFTLDGSIYGTSVKLKAVPTGKKYFVSLELNLVFIPPSALRGHQSFRKGRFSGSETKAKNFEKKSE